MLANIKTLLASTPLRLSKKARYLAVSLSFSSVALVSGQLILFLELQSLTLSHCRRLNLQNIFFYNQIISTTHEQSLITIATDDHDFTAPEYCHTFLVTEQSDSSRSISLDEMNNLSSDLRLRVYADIYADAEQRYADYQMNLLILLLASNVLALIFQSIHLYQDSTEIS